MPGQTYATDLKVGDRCIIEVDSVNSPVGWWWGVVDHYYAPPAQGKVDAHITGEFVFTSRFSADPRFIGPLDPNYGTGHSNPSVNYRVYGTDRDTVDLVRKLQVAKKEAVMRETGLTTRLDELRGILKSFGKK